MWCFHIGRPLDYRGCNCHFKWVFDCDIHDQCTLLPEKPDTGRANCLHCKDYEAGWK